MKTSPIAAYDSDSLDEDLDLQEVKTTPVEDSIALNSPRREIRKSTRYTDMVPHALRVADDTLTNYREKPKALKVHIGMWLWKMRCSLSRRTRHGT